MDITTSKNGDTMTLAIIGRIDTNTSPALQSEILKAFQGTKHLILDFQEVAYISSAGLRALLIGQKTATSKSAVMELINIGPMVMSVLVSVGFAKVLNIR